jgi:RNA polymerase sigma-70 factor (ECF subfamily)
LVFKYVAVSLTTQIPVPVEVLHNERELLLRIAEGDEKAFTDLFNHYYTLLRPFILKFSKLHEDTEEIIQETFIRVWLNRDNLVEIENFHSWIFTIASRLCLMLIRKNLNNQKKAIAYDQKQLSNVSETPADSFQVAEITRLINKAVNLMPPQRKRIYRMSREEGMKPADIAKSLSLSVHTVKNVLVTALKEIRSYLLDAGHIVSLILIFKLFYK